MSKINNIEKQFLLENYKGKTSKELAEIFKVKFKNEITYKQIQNFKKARGLKSGVNTKFNKGDIPHNTKKIGEEFLSKDGYVYMKIAEPNKWELKHRHIYETKYGKIPKGHSVIFLDGNKTNFCINNLILIEDKVKLIMKNLHLFSSDVEITKQEY